MPNPVVRWLFLLAIVAFFGPISAANAATTSLQMSDQARAATSLTSAPPAPHQALLPLVINNGANTAPVVIPWWAPERTGRCLSDAEAELAWRINEYRVANGLPPVAVTRSLTAVAQWHVADLATHHPDSGVCNLHSWSGNGYWSPVCYTPDHAQAAAMWNKPREITANAYFGNGYEIAFGGPGGYRATPVEALAGWQKSSGHNAVMLEQGAWAGANWPAMGVGLHEGYAVVWFGDQPDPQGPMGPCSP